MNLFRHIRFIEINRKYFFWPVPYLEPNQASMNKFFWENSLKSLAVNYFYEKKIFIDVW